MKKITLIITILTLLFAETAQAGGATTGGASEWTQVLNYKQLYDQTTNSISSLSTQMSQLDNLRKQVTAGGAINDFSSSKKLFSDVVSSVQQAQGIGYSAQVMAGRFSSMYPDFNSRSGTNFFQSYGAMNKDLNSMLKASMGTANLHVGNFANDQVTNQTLQDKVRSANTQESQIAVINAGNEVALGTYQEMQQLRQMEAVQNAAQSSYMAVQTGQADKKVAQDHALDQMFSKKSEMRTYQQQLDQNK